MSEEQQEQQEQKQVPQELDLQQSFNLLVNLARQSKLTYEEHALVDRSVQKIAEKLEVNSSNHNVVLHCHYSRCASE